MEAMLVPAVASSAAAAAAVVLEDSSVVEPKGDAGGGRPRRRWEAGEKASHVDGAALANRTARTALLENCIVSRKVSYARSRGRCEDVLFELVDASQSGSPMCDVDVEVDVLWTNQQFQSHSGDPL